MCRGSRLWYRQGRRNIVDFIYYFRRKLQGKSEIGRERRGIPTDPQLQTWSSPARESTASSEAPQLLPFRVDAGDGDAWIPSLPTGEIRL